MARDPIRLTSSAAAALRGPTPADLDAARARVAALRAAHPGATDDALVRIAVNRAATRSAAVGAITAGSALVPGAGSVVALTVGAAADVGTMLGIHTRLVLDIAGLRGAPLDAEAAGTAVLVVAGVSLAGTAFAGRLGRGALRHLSGRAGARWLLRAVPVIGLVAASGANALATRVMGHRADAYFRLGPDAVGDWRASVKAVSGLDAEAVRRALDPGRLPRPRLRLRPGTP